ncbi:MAG: hypothetical protein CMD77_04855 [Gammaproteobacteria bacterium]|nr:hypothetical protein [Gammaproteobacteria bacterium]
MKPVRDLRGKPPLRPLNWRRTTPEELINRIETTNIVGMGGGGFPTAKKLRQAKLYSKQKFAIANAVDCNPGVTADTTLLEYYMPDVIDGLRIVGRALHTTNLYLATSKAINGETNDISIHTVVAPYPSGEERIVIFNVLGRQIDASTYPSQTGIVVLNVATLFAISEAVKGYPPVDRIISTPSGDQWVKAGTRVDSLGQSLTLGGAIIGKPSGPDTLINLTNDAVSTLQTSPLPCINCGWCNNKCPLDLDVVSILRGSEKDDIRALKDLNTPVCYECGACVAVCPSNIRLLDFIRKAKGNLQTESRKRNQANRFEDRSKRHNDRVEQKKNTSIQQREKRISQKRPWN